MDRYKKQSETIKELWKEGRYDNRDESYRNKEEYKNKVSDTVTKVWKSGKYGEERNRKISESLKGKPKPWLHKEIPIYEKSCEYCHKQFTSQFVKQRFCSKSCSAKGVTRKIDPIKEIKRRKKISEKLKGKLPKNINELHGDQHWNWKGGIACEPYCEIWTDEEYKKYIKERDGNKCLNPTCNKIFDTLHIHHIDYNKKNCHPNNLITICVSCNGKANKDREWHTAWYKAIILKRYLNN